MNSSKDPANPQVTRAFVFCGIFDIFTTCTRESVP